MTPDRTIFRVPARTVCVISVLAFPFGCAEQSSNPTATTPPDDPAPQAVPRQHESEAPPEAMTGHELFIARCAPCHGYDGRGDGPIAEFLPARPRGLVSDEWQFVEHTDAVSEREGIANIIRLGIIESHMPAFQDQLSETEINAIVTHVLTIRENDRSP